MKAFNHQLLACGIVFGLAAAVILWIFVMGLQKAPQNPNGMSARTAAIERLNEEIRRQ